MFFTLFGFWVRGGGGSPKGLLHNVLMQIFALGSPEISNFFF